VGQQGKLVSCEPVAIQQGSEHRNKGMSTVRFRYQATNSEDTEVLVFAVVVCRVRKSVEVFCSYELYVSNKSNYQSEPHVGSLTCDNAVSSSDYIALNGIIIGENWKGYGRKLSWPN
jgi:hypothetical protein